MNRRDFARSAAFGPFAMALSRSFGVEQAATIASQLTLPPAKQRRAPKTAAEYNKHPFVSEPDPFAAPLIFSRNETQQRVIPFELSEVSLIGGPLSDARDWSRAYMMRLPNDRLLHNFRVTAGLPSSATPLGGWEAPTAELRGHFVGHYLSASALLYAATGDLQIKNKADELVSGIGQCQRNLNSGGYVSAFPQELFDRLDRREKVWAPFYTLHKIMAGLIDMNTLADNEQALRIGQNLAAWVDTWTATKSEEHMQDILNTEYGGMNDVLYRLAFVSGDDRWARTGDRFTKKVFFTPLAMRQDKLKGLHANTHMPLVVGAALRYELTGDYRFGELSQFFWETIAESRTYVSGGSANTESWLTNANRLALERKASSHHQECCCAYNMMKLTRHLYSWSADPKYIEYYERNLLNHRLGCIQPKTGLTTYFLSMSPGAWKTTCTEDQTFWCCTGSALEDYAKLNDTIYYHDDTGIYVNLFASSDLHWKNKNIYIEQRTDFPNTDRSVVTIKSTPESEWALHLRVPAWTTTSNFVQINSQRLPLTGTPGSYLTIRRNWKPGDRVELVMPMRLRRETLADDKTQQAFLYGPLVLAGQFPLGEIDFDLLHNQGPEIQELPPFKVPELTATSNNLDDWIEPVSGPSLTFATTGQQQNITLKPLNESWERFAVYWTVS